MLIYKNSKLTICFGDSSCSLSVEEIALRQKTESIFKLKKQLNIDNIAFLQQTHGVQGLHINQDDTQDYYFNLTGDFIVTKKIGYGIGILTADCLSIVVYDRQHHAVSMIHAGWKGLAAGIFQHTLHVMQEKLHSQFKNLEIYLGPSARGCCYQVQQDFIDAFIDYAVDFNIFFIKKENKVYFDSRLFITVIARNLGIDAQKIYTRYNVCTICDISYCSYRRQKEKARRQISMVCLH